MSSLSLLNSSGVMPFLTLTAVFLFIGPVLIIGIATMWSNLKQKISDELSAHVIKILIDLGILNNIPEIGKRSLHDQIFTELNDKFDTCISDINSTFTAKLGSINNDLNNKLNEEVNAGFGKINTELTAVFIFIGTIGNFEPDSRSDMSGVGSRDLHIRWQIIVKTLEGLTTRQIAKHVNLLLVV